jgi:hypothetical protein
MKELFPEQLEGISQEDFVRAANATECSLIRTEADELTYPLHILIRYEIEKGIFDGSVDVNDLENFYPGLAAVELKQLYAGVAPVTNAPFEIILVEVANEADVQTVLDIFQARVDRESGDSTYPENAEAWMNKCRITSRGNYVFLAVLMGSYEIPAQFILD